MKPHNNGYCLQVRYWCHFNKYLLIGSNKQIPHKQFNNVLIISQLDEIFVFIFRL